MEQKPCGRYDIIATFCKCNFSMCYEPSCPSVGWLVGRPGRNATFLPLGVLVFCVKRSNNREVGYETYEINVIISCMILNTHLISLSLKHLDSSSHALAMMIVAGKEGKGGLKRFTRDKKKFVCYGTKSCAVIAQNILSRCFLLGE